MSRFLLILISLLITHQFADARDVTINIPLSPGRNIEVENLTGRVDIRAFEPADAASGKLTASSDRSIEESEIKLTNNRGNIIIKVAPSDPKKRIDLVIEITERTRIRAKTEDGEIRLQGNIESANATTVTGTIAVDVPTSDLRYNLRWLASRPRFLADFELSKVQERSGGRFEIKGNYKTPSLANEQNAAPVTLDLTTERGIILVNVPPNEVTADLRQRPLTEAAKAIIRSGDQGLIDAIRRSSPKYFGDYISTLPPYRRPPTLLEKNNDTASVLKTSRVGSAVIRVTDSNNRTVNNISSDDLELLEDGVSREIISIRQVDEPVNLVLLLDVSGSVENYVNFIRKAARSFVETVEANDRIKIITFNEEVNVLSSFSNDKEALSKSLDTFDAGGSTAYYDALAYTLVESIVPLKGERTAIVILTDGDDNRSFIPFDPLISTLMESGALIYPLYVPSSLIAASESGALNRAVDPLRSRYMGLSVRAEGEGERLAKVSGGTYYSISRLSEIQEAYNDIIDQLRTVYEITYNSELKFENSERTSPRVRVRVKNPNIFANIISLSDEDRR